MLHVVTKPISGPEGKTIPSGTLVRATGWKNFTSLLNLRYLRPVTPEDVDGLEEIEVDDHGISDVNVMAPKAKKKAVIKKAKKAKKAATH